jgi:predicted translation initiation factor SUI1
METLNKNVANLIVRLILKGGKRQPLANPSAPTQQTGAQASKAAAQAAVRVGLESKGRGGKKVSVITGLPLSDSAFEDLTTKLKRSCGTGGTYKDQQIEIQGDHREKLMSELQKLGYKPKRTGG